MSYVPDAPDWEQVVFVDNAQASTANDAAWYKAQTGTVYLLAPASVPDVVQAAAVSSPSTGGGVARVVTVTLATAPTPGNLLVLGSSYHGPTGVAGTPAGWTELFNTDNWQRACYWRIAEEGDPAALGFLVPDAGSDYSVNLGVWEIANPLVSSPLVYSDDVQANGDTPWSDWITLTPTTLFQFPLCLAEAYSGGGVGSSLHMTTAGWETDALATSEPGASGFDTVILAHGPAITSLTPSDLSSAATTAGDGVYIAGFDVLVSITTTPVNVKVWSITVHGTAGDTPTVTRSDTGQLLVSGTADNTAVTQSYPGGLLIPSSAYITGDSVDACDYGIVYNAYD